MHEVAPGEFQARVSVSPVATVDELVGLVAVSVTCSRPMPSCTSLPVPAASSADCSVAVPVVLVVSAVELQTAASDVNCAVMVSGVGAARGETGHTPAVFSPLTNCANDALPTARLLESISAPPEAPAPVRPN